MQGLKHNNGLDSLFHRSPPSIWQQFWKQPCVYLANQLYRPSSYEVSQIDHPSIKVVCISDTHNAQFQVPYGEILIHAGDTTQSGSLKEFQSTLDWLETLPHKHKILIAGNHELLLDPDQDDRANNQEPEARQKIVWHDIVYLEKSSTTLICSGGRRIKIYGNPMTPKHGNWAFQHLRNVDVWTGNIPEDVDILVTHGAPLGHLDIASWGCRYLLDAIWCSKPSLHVFGHLHDGYGTEMLTWSRRQKAFEDLQRERGGVLRLLWLACMMLLEWFGSFNTYTFSTCVRPKTILVNAAVAGGRFDEPVRKAIVVEI